MKVSHMHFSKTNLPEIINEESLYSRKELIYLQRRFRSQGRQPMEIVRSAFVQVVVVGGRLHLTFLFMYASIYFV